MNLPRVGTRSLVFAVPGDPEQRTGGYVYDARLAAALRARGWRVETCRLPASYPLPSDADLAESARLLAALPAGSLALIDGLAFGAMPELAEAEAERLRLAALVHHPLAFKTGLDARTAERLRASERRALARARRILVTSSTTRDTLIRDFGVPVERIAVAPPGTDPAPLARGSPRPPLRLLAVGAVVPRKGFAALVRALAPLRELAWRLTIVGSLKRSRDAVAELRRAIEAARLEERVVLAGEIPPGALAAAYDGSDLFVSASAYEGYGMALAEAVARGLPCVAVAGGAVGEWLSPDAALLVPPNDGDALSDALGRAIADPALRRRLRAGARTLRQRLPRWEDTAETVEAALLEVLKA